MQLQQQLQRITKPLETVYCGLQHNTPSRQYECDTRRVDLEAKTKH